jgi:hypothetical protein
LHLAPPHLYQEKKKFNSRGIQVFSYFQTLSPSYRTTGEGVILGTTVLSIFVFPHFGGEGVENLPSQDAQPFLKFQAE